MKLKLKLSTFFGGLILAGFSFAGQQFECPRIDVIKSEGLTMSEQVLKNLYFTFHLSQYSTHSVWAFVIAPIEGDSEELALVTGNELLNSMTSRGVPVMDEEGVMVCEYASGQEGVMAAAAKADGLLSTMKLRNLLLKKAH